jgi:signal transduction histidine kinase
VERSRRALEQEVAARTAELALANRRLAQASEAKSQYLANMSHELRTPLNAILGYTQLLADEARDDGRGTADLERVERAGTHLLALVNDVLDLSKIEAGRMEFTLGAVELGPLVTDVLDALRPVIERAGATVTTDLPPGLVALADAHRVRQILTNLVGNAVKFTGAGAVAIRGLDLDGALRIEVRDSGPGIPPDAAARLFRPFAQASASTARTHGGTGLGLVISRELARAMNGDVAFSSVPGAGATFWLDLPRG